MIEVRVIKPFRYCRDGINGVWVEIGQELGLPDGIVPGLVAEGFVEEIVEEIVAEPEPVTQVTAEVAAEAPLVPTMAQPSQPVPTRAGPRRSGR